MSIVDIKDISKKMTLKEFTDRFIEEHQGYRDSTTEKMYYCPRDFGFDFTRENCDSGLSCKICWRKAKRRLMFNQCTRKDIK